jgi:DNA-directed RNA polymerase subunit M/transcription elongation factor TFIIS
MDIYKLFPEIWADIIDEKTKTEKILRDSLEESASDLFKCPRCHKSKTIHCEVQTRSSDEPMTTFITCLECGKKWKKY